MNHQAKLLTQLLKPRASILLHKSTNCQVSRFTNFLQGFQSPNAKTDWNKAILDAEKVVGYTTSYLNLRFLLSDEMSNIAYHLRSLVGSGHPLLKTAKKILADGKTSMQTRSLTVLLLSKAAGFGDLDVSAAEKSSGLLQSQRVLAEITEMLHTGFMIHRCIVRIPLKMQNSGVNISAKENMDFGNKLSILTGDYLFANASTLLASLRNPKVVEIVSAAIGDFSESEFYGKKSVNGSQEFDSKFLVSDWLAKIETSAASLLARSCQAALVLSGHSENHQKNAYELGRNLAIACQANEDITAFNNAVSNSKYDLDGSSLPLVIWLSKSSHNLEAPLLPEKIIKMANTDEVLSQAQELKYSYLKLALENLSFFPTGIARDALEKIMNSLR